jgi:lipopolysaccharide transport system ATP-binding protein
MSDLAIRVENLGKQFHIGATDPDARFNYRTLRETISEGLTSPFARLTRRGSDEKTIIWALRNLSFEVRRGEVLGIIGRNGAGKSTLLKILSRVTEPSEGYAEIYGRVGALLEVGTGFHPELTGRENIYLNGAILGMKRGEIERKFDEMVDFAGVEKFIDTPVKRYSTGMYLRLAFSVAAHLEPEILVVDEVLAVGDAEFQQKCLGKMTQVAEEGRTVLFVSHNMSAILRLTQEAIVLDQGSLLLRAPTAEAVDEYLTKGFAEAGERVWAADEIPPEAGPFRPVALRVVDDRGHVTDSVRSVDPITIELEYQLAEAISGLRVGIYLMTVRGEYLFASFDTDDPEKFEQYGARAAGRYISRCRIPANFLNEGRFLIGMNASTFRIKRYFMEERSLTFTVDGIGAPGSQWHELRPGPIRPQLDWQIQQAEPQQPLQMS